MRTGILKAALIVLAAGLTCGLRAEEIPPAEPVVSAPPVDPLLFSPSWQSVRAQFNREIAHSKAQRLPLLLPILQRGLQAAERDLAEARRVRNATGIRVAQTFRDTLNTARTAVGNGQPVEWPETVRPEMREQLKGVRDEIDAASQIYDEKVRQLRTEQLARFSDALRKAGHPVPEEVQPVFENWLTQDPPKPEEPLPVEPNPATGEAVKPPEDVPPPEPPKEYFAESGLAEGEWTPVGRWTADMMGPDIFRVPVYACREPQKGSQRNQLSGQSSDWIWEPVQALPEGSNYVFRLKRLEDRTPVDVIQWPGAGNQDPLVLRTPYTKEIPARVGFELQWAARSPPKEDPALVEARDELAAKGIDIPVITRPPGARIGVNGRVYSLPSGEDAVTPCTIRLMPGTVRLTLVLADYVDHDVPEFQVSSGIKMQWQFQAEMDLAGTPVRVDSKVPWKRTPIEVKRGDKIWVIPDGSWTIGERGETCDAGGYGDAKFLHYSVAKAPALRQMPSAPYGALLVRIGQGKLARPVLIDKPVKFTANTAGFLFFDTNESVDSKARLNNRGFLNLKVIVLPKK